MYRAKIEPREPGPGIFSAGHLVIETNEVGKFILSLGRRFPLFRYGPNRYDKCWTECFAAVIRNWKTEVKERMKNGQYQWLKRSGNRKIFRLKMASVWENKIFWCLYENDAKQGSTVTIYRLLIHVILLKKFSKILKPILYHYYVNTGKNRVVTYL